MTAPVIRLTGIEKSYPGVKSLDNVDFAVAPGEIHALLGENGAGKSTLTAVMGGAVKPNAGTIEYLGRNVVWRSPKEAQAAGIHVIHQELALFPELTVAENILLTEQPRGPLGLISPKARLKRVQTALDRLGVSIPASARIGDLTLADQQMVEIAKALVGEPRLLVFDEPTAVIAGREVDLLFDNMRKMRSLGIGIVYISHRLDEIFEVADRVTILKDGKLVGTHPIGSLTRDDMINLMVGRRLEQIFPPRPAKPTRRPSGARGRPVERRRSGQGRELKRARGRDRRDCWDGRFGTNRGGRSGVRRARRRIRERSRSTAKQFPGPGLASRSGAAWDF